jgi:hypothetical protein
MNRRRAIEAFASVATLAVIAAGLGCDIAPVKPDGGPIPMDSSHDAPADISSEAAGDGGPADACMFTAYTRPGCGADAVPTDVTCGPDSGAEAIVCTCDGRTLTVFGGYSSVPFLAYLPCDAVDASSDARTD